MKVRAFITQHKAEKISECQDRLSVNEDTKTVAISDGVSQSIFPDYWAQLLVDFYTQNGALSNEDRLILCSEWKKQVLRFIEEEKAKGNNPWRTESNLYEGISAGATLCGVRFEDDKKWICEVIGDTCLIKVDKNSDIDILSSEDKKFDTYPDYLDSNPDKKGRGIFKTYNGAISENDQLILVSDPFSDFFYNLKDESGNYIKQLLNINTHDEFVSLVSQWREKGMHNDDSTVIIIEWDNSSNFNIVWIDDLIDLIETEKKETEKCNLAEKCFEKELSTTQANDRKQEEIENKKDEIERITIDDFKQKCIGLIPLFVDSYTNGEVSLPKHTKYKSLIRYMFSKKKEKAEELSSFLEDVLMGFIKTIK